MVPRLPSLLASCSAGVGDVLVAVHSCGNSILEFASTDKARTGCVPILSISSDLCGILSHLEMNDFSAVMAKHDQGIENPKRRGCHNEHVDRRDIGQVVVQEATPSRGGDFRSPRQVSPDGGLADLDAELEQVAVDAGRAPQSGVARLIWRIRSRISVLVLSRPGRRDRHRQ